MMLNNLGSNCIVTFFGLAISMGVRMSAADAIKNSSHRE